MQTNDYYRAGAATAALLMTTAIYFWLNILAPNGPLFWCETEIALPLKHSSTEFPTDLIRRLTRQTAVIMHIKFDPTVSLPHVFILPKEDMREAFGKQIDNGVYLHHRFMPPKIFVAKRKLDHLTGRDVIRGIMKYLNDAYPDQFNVNRIPILERRLVPPLQSC